MATPPEKTNTVILKPDSQFILRLLNVILLILSLVTLLSLLAGGLPIHCLSGIFLLIGCGIHLALHARWISAVILQTPKNDTPIHRRKRRLFWGQVLSGLVCGLSGLIAGLGSLPLVLQRHFLLPLHCCGTPLHVLSGLVFFGLNIHHLLLHRKSFRKKQKAPSTSGQPGNSSPSGHSVV